MSVNGIAQGFQGKLDDAPRISVHQFRTCKTLSSKSNMELGPGVAKTFDGRLSAGFSYWWTLKCRDQSTLGPSESPDLNKVAKT